MKALLNKKYIRFDINLVKSFHGMTHDSLFILTVLKLASFGTFYNIFLVIKMCFFFVLFLSFCLMAVWGRQIYELAISLLLKLTCAFFF